MSKVLEKEERKANGKALTEEEVAQLVKRLKAGLKERISDTHEEEPGLSERARHFIIKY